MNDLAFALKEKQLKVTPQRLSIYKLLCSTHLHPSAETVYKGLLEEQPTMSLATVYKTLDTFRKAGLIYEINVGEDSFRYDANIKPHCHFFCKSCNKVVDLAYDENIKKLKDNFNAASGYEIESEQLYFFGKCEICK